MESTSLLGLLLHNRIALAPNTKMENSFLPFPFNKQVFVYVLGFQNYSLAIWSSNSILFAIQLITILQWFVSSCLMTFGSSLYNLPRLSKPGTGPGTDPIEPEKPVRAKNRDKTGSPVGRTGNLAYPVSGYPVLAFFFFPSFDHATPFLKKLHNFLTFYFIDFF